MFRVIGATPYAKAALSAGRRNSDIGLRSFVPGAEREPNYEVPCSVVPEPAILSVFIWLITRGWAIPFEVSLSESAEMSGDERFPPNR